MIKNKNIFLLYIVHTYSNILDIILYNSIKISARKRRNAYAASSIVKMLY